MAAAPARADRQDQALLSAYAAARAADSKGDSSRAARGYAAVLAAAPGNPVLASRALGQAVVAGDRKLALQAARSLARNGQLTADARLLLLGEALESRNAKAAAQHVEAITGDKVFAFMAPVLRAWVAFDARKGDPLALLAAAQAEPLAAGYAAEHRPLMLLAMGEHQQGAAELLAMTGEPSGRAARLRIAGAALLARKGDRERALTLLEGAEPALAAARRLVEAGRPLPGEIADASAGIAEFLVRLAVDLHRQDIERVALAYARLSTFMAPGNSETWLVTSELLAAAGNPREAIAVLARVRADDPFAANAEDARVKLLAAAGDSQAALAQAEAAVKGPAASAASWTRLGDLYNQLERLDEAAAAYGQAITLLNAGGGTQPEWALHLLQGGALERAGRWPQAKAALQAAYRLAPDQPVVLNYLGYAQLERRENQGEAMRLIAQAAKLQPDSPEITDSLGWAYFLRGDLGQAIPLLEKAVAGGPADPEINEHLGDAYYRAGRRIEARFAWGAALTFAEAKDQPRLRGKIETGLAPATAAR
jgi:Flp pilus assembly protein TadD